MSRKSDSQIRRSAGIGPRIPEWALLLLPFIALTPNFFIIPDLAYPGNATLEVAMGWTTTALLALGIAAIALYRPHLEPTRRQIQIFAPLALFLLWQTVSLIWAPDWAEGVRVASVWFAFTVFFGTGLLTLTQSGTGRLYYALTALALILSISQAYEYRLYGNEMFGVFFSHGITTELLALIIPLQIVVYVTNRSRAIALISIATAAAGGAAIVLTLRRGAMLGILVAFVLVGVALLRGWLKPAERWRVIAVAAAAVLFLTGPLMFKRDYFIERLRSAFEIRTASVGHVTDIGLTSRLTKWFTTLEMIRHNPVMGVGQGGFSAKYGEARRSFVENPLYARIAQASEAEDFDELRSPQAHNEYLQIFAELGLIGILLFATFWFGVLRTLWRARSSDQSVWAIGALAGLTAFGISSAMSAFSFRFAPGGFITACIAAIGCAAALRETNTSEQQISNFRFPKAAAIGLLSALIVVSGAMLFRAQNVLASQKTQSQNDFRYSLESQSFNDSVQRRYRQVLHYDPANSGAHLGFALLLYQMKRPAEGIPHAEYALMHGYSRPYTFLVLAFLYEATGDTARAQQLIDECLASYPRSLITRAYNIVLLQKLGENELAEKQQRILEEHDRKNGRSWFLALTMKDEDSDAAAKREGLMTPRGLEPMLVRGLVHARAYHYLDKPY
ncbi:MAG: O-antigen ligase family protein [Acidobacteria bacterium]|nr:O-antigen ligase family protein [Acidobacteriota bacterium]